MVLQFFPLPFTGVCEAQWDRDHDFDVPILADYDHEVSRSCVGLYEDPVPQGLRLCSKRAVLEISSDGIVPYYRITQVPGVGPDDDVVPAAPAKI